MSNIVGVFWGLWNLNFEFGITGFVLYTITITELSVLFTWFYNKTDGNILIAVIFHSLINIMTRILLSSEIGIKMFIVEIIVFGVCCIFVLNVSDLNNSFKADKFDLFPKDSNL